jgi:hypothetical protein
VFIDATLAANKKVCSNHIRGCRSQLDPDDSYSRCESCRKVERTRDQERRAAAAIAAQVSANATEKTCTTCRKVLSMDMFQGEKAGVTTKTCRPCRDDNKKQDAKRDLEHRNALARVTAAKPERKQNKRAYRDENHEKMVQYDLTSKARRLESLGPEGYLAHNAAQAATWRSKNPEKYAAFNEKRRTDLHQFFKANYVQPSKNKILEFTITEEDFASIAREPCFYCGEMENIEVDGVSVERGFNGIDRKDQTRGYVLDNCVSACNMCNIMKKSLHVDIFLKRVEHMVSYNFQMETEAKRFPHVFRDHMDCKFITYVNSAKKRNKHFYLTRDEFNAIVNNNCYLCDKPTSETHLTGIDRFDSSIGYIFDNCRPCCGECNYMKNDYEFDFFREKLLIIYHHRILPSKSSELTNSFVDVAPTELQFMSIMQRSQKKTKIEIAKKSMIRKQKSHDHLRETLGDEEYRRKHATDVAERRRKKKQNSASEL